MVRQTGHNGVERVIVEQNKSWWSGTSHGGAEQVIVEWNGLVLELTLVQAIQARPLRCQLCHIVSYSKRKEFVTIMTQPQQEVWLSLAFFRLGMLNTTSH